MEIISDHPTLQSEQMTRLVSVWTFSLQPELLYQSSSARYDMSVSDFPSLSWHGTLLNSGCVMTSSTQGAKNLANLGPPCLVTTLTFMGRLQKGSLVSVSKWSFGGSSPSSVVNRISSGFPSRSEDFAEYFSSYAAHLLFSSWYLSASVFVLSSFTPSSL